MIVRVSEVGRWTDVCVAEALHCLDIGEAPTMAVKRAIGQKEGRKKKEKKGH